MAYGVIPIIASILLAVHHVAATDATRRSKLLVGLVVAASLAVWWHYPKWLVPAMLVQVGVSIYMLVYLRVQGAPPR